MNKKDWLLLGLFTILLLILVSTSKQIIFHDSIEYFNLIKDFAGFQIIKAHSTHSMLYTYILSFLVELLPAIKTIQILNVLWLIPIAILIRKYTNKSTYLLFLFSPMVWIAAPELTPVMPAAFFTTLAYFQIKKWQNNNKNKHLWITAISLGFSMAIYTPMFFVALMFLIAFMRKTTVKKLIPFSILAGLFYLPRIILDYKLTGLPFYSEIRFFGANLKNALGLGATGDAGMIAGLLIFETTYFIFLISPLLFMLYKTNFKKYKNELFFIITVTAFFLVTGSYIKYILIPSAIIFYLLSKVLTKKLLYLHIILSIILTLIFVIPFYSPVEASYPTDLEQIQNDFDIGGAILHPTVAVYLWEGSYFLPEEYYAFTNDEEYFSTLSLQASPTYYYDKILEIQGNLLIAQDERVKDATLWISHKDDPVPEEFIQEKCYEEICVSKKIST
ncbi:hypothetical protein HN840_02280 [archaeon]|jgi:hypothetical protein|nr:hypothetical protein [archaeon]MBT5288177.1 hypothetical protein [archaeon]MBT7281136.1 hypothetical protein [archaeon]